MKKDLIIKIISIICSFLKVICLCAISVFALILMCNVFINTDKIGITILVLCGVMAIACIIKFLLKD